MAHGWRGRRSTSSFAAGAADGGYAPSPDPAYAGESDTKFSDLAAVTYAAVLARTMGWELPQKEPSIAFIRRHQQPDGRFVNLAGKHDPASDLGILYNTTQGVVGLRALGAKPDIDPIPAIERLLAGDAYKKLPWYTTSFFPLLCAALGQAVSRRVAGQACAAHGSRARPRTATWAITSPRPSTWPTFSGCLANPRREPQAWSLGFSGTRSPMAAGTSRSPTGTSTPASTPSSSSASSAAMIPR